MPKKKTTQGRKKSTKKQTKQARKGAKKKVHAVAKKRGSIAAGARPRALMATAVIPDLLGFVKATSIVTGCAGVTDTTKKLGDTGIDLLIFQTCVKNGIVSAGFKPTGIPASAGNTLDDVVNEIAQSQR
jgi:hypothetical protein